MDVILVIIGLSVFFVFLFKREVLEKTKSAIYIATLCAILFFAGIILFYFNIKIASTLMIPLVQFVLYRLFYFTFVKIYKRKPKDTWWSMDLSLMADGIFNFICVLLALGFPLVWLF